MLTLSNPVVVGSNGGALNLGPDASGQRRAAVSFTGGITLNGNLTVTGNSWGNTLVNPPSLGSVTLNTNAKISSTMFNTPATVNLGPNLAGSAHTLTLASGPFAIGGATAASIDLGNLTVDNGASLSLGAGNGVNPLSQIKTHGGLLTIGNGSTLTFHGTGSSSGPILDPTAIAWQGNGTLNLPVVGGGNGDSYWRITTNLVVSSASGLTRVNYDRWRGLPRRSCRRTRPGRSHPVAAPPG